MKLGDYHTHCNLCNHAVGTIEDYIRVGIQSNLHLTDLGVSDHFPMHLLPEPFHIYAMSPDQFPSYIQQARELKKKYKSQINVLISSEVDYFLPVFHGYRKALRPYLDELDYIIGSVHAIPWDNEYGALPIDTNFAIPQIMKIGVDKVYLEYYQAIIKMIKSKFFHIIGHFDIPKKYGLLPINYDLIWDRIIEVLDIVENNGILIEINTSGLRRPFKEQYPSDDIIQESIKRKIPLILGSDAHQPQDIGYRFEDIISKLRKWGLKKLYRIVNQELFSYSIL